MRESWSLYARTDTRVPPQLLDPGHDGATTCFLTNPAPIEACRTFLIVGAGSCFSCYLLIAVSSRRRAFTASGKKHT
jgi:hypothetical protein